MPREANPCNKAVTREEAYEVWQTPNGQWTWYVLKKWQSPSNEARNEYARWYCNVVSPMTSERGETGDVYLVDIKAYATKLDYNPCVSYHVEADNPISQEFDEHIVNSLRHLEEAESLFLSLQKEYQDVMLLKETKKAWGVLYDILSVYENHLPTEGFPF